MNYLSSIKCIGRSLRNHFLKFYNCLTRNILRCHAILTASKKPSRLCTTAGHLPLQTHLMNDGNQDQATKSRGIPAKELRLLVCLFFSKQFECLHEFAYCLNQSPNIFFSRLTRNILRRHAILKASKKPSRLRTTAGHLPLQTHLMNDGTWN